MRKVYVFQRAEGLHEGFGLDGNCSNPAGFRAPGGLFRFLVHARDMLT